MKIRKGGEVQIVKVDKENRMVFGFFSVTKVAGEVLLDQEQDGIETAVLEKSVYDFVLNARIAGDSHLRKGVGNLVESMVFTQEKEASILKTLTEQMGIEAPQMNLGIEGWWGGFEITDDAVLEKIEKGEYLMFSIGGSATREEIEEE